MPSNAVEKCIAERSSTRAFLPDAIDRETIEAVLSSARQAPSGANLQPGQFHVLTGSALINLKATLAQAVDTDRPFVNEYSYFPEPFSAELKTKQRDAGYALYSALGIEKRDIPARRAQFARNYQFFDAPVGIVVTIERAMGKGCFMDMGMTLMSLFVSAESRGLGACGIGALANYADVVHHHLALPDDEMVVCGIALGMPDTTHAVNKVRTTRAPLSEFSRFYGFSE